MNDLTWVERTKTVDAIDTATVAALDANPGWRLLVAGVGAYGQATLTYGWPWSDADQAVCALAAVPEACTGVTARWCTIHGDCTCPTSDDSDIGDPACPLHAPGSTHAEEMIAL